MSEKKKIIALKIARILLKFAFAIMKVIEGKEDVLDKSVLENEVLPNVK